jgi:hypothetical protein
MDLLTVYAQAPTHFDNHARVRVYCRSGARRQSAVDVTLALSCQDPLAAAEAIAIRYLLGEVCIFNANRTGINLKLVVSKGALKKLARQATRKFDLYEYGHPLLTRYAEAEVAVSKDRSWFPGEDKLGEIPLIDGERRRGIEKLHSDGMGLIAVTRHALERYAAHCGTLDRNTAWKNLHRRLKGRLDPIPLSAPVLRHKLKKYGEAPEVWKHPDNPLHYVFCHQSDHKLLVTVFNKDPDEPRVFRPALANRC